MPDQDIVDLLAGHFSRLAEKVRVGGAMISIENAPRSTEGLLRLKRMIRFRLAHSLGMFSSHKNPEVAEAAFNCLPDWDQAHFLSERLHRLDNQP